MFCSFNEAKLHYLFLLWGRESVLIFSAQLEVFLFKSRFFINPVTTDSNDLPDHLQRMSVDMHRVACIAWLWTGNSSGSA